MTYKHKYDKFCKFLKGTRTVSYTHLDVYKRQQRNWRCTLTADAAQLNPYRTTERQARRLIYRRRLLTETTNIALYAVNKHIPDLDSFLHKLHRKCARNVKTRSTLQSSPLSSTEPPETPKDPLS